MSSHNVGRTDAHSDAEGNTVMRVIISDPSDKRVRVRAAVSDEHEAISALALRSKGHWGYSPEFLDACRAELTFGPEVCGSGRMAVAVTEAGDLVGFSLITGTPPSGELAALFVDPAAIGTGCGKLLLEHALRDASERGFTRLVLDADPGAESFYAHFGATRIGSRPSGSIPGRLLPHMFFSVPRSDDTTSAQR
jgi:GNAT superfamily N-acetyltransferase